MAQTLPNTKNDLIVSLIQRHLTNDSLLLPFVSDLSMYAVKGTKSISIPKLSGLTATNRTMGAAGTESTMTDSVDTINIDHNAYVSWVEDHADIVQSTIEFRMAAAERAAIAQSQYVDNAIMSALESAAALSVNGGTAADITSAMILEMREAIIKAGGQQSWMNSVLFVSADQDTAMLKLPEFTRADIYGTSNIARGQIGYVYGAPVVVHNGMAAQQALMFAKEGFGIAFQKQVSLAEEKNIAYGTQGVKVAVDQLFGVGGLEIGERGAAAGKSPLIAKLRD